MGKRQILWRVIELELRAAEAHLEDVTVNLITHRDDFGISKDEASGLLQRGEALFASVSALHDDILLAAGSPAEPEGDGI